MLILGVQGWMIQSSAESAASSHPVATAAAHQSSAASFGAVVGDAAGDVVLSPENLTQAAIIIILDVVIICSNLLIIATLATGSGTSIIRLLFSLYLRCLFIPISENYASNGRLTKPNQEIRGVFPASNPDGPDLLVGLMGLTSMTIV